MFGELLPFILHYFLVDDTIEVLEAHRRNDGRDPFPMLIHRQKIPKDRDNVVCEFYHVTKASAYYIEYYNLFSFVVLFFGLYLAIG